MPRNVGFRAVLLIVAVVLLEGASYAGLVVVRGDLRPLERLEADRRALLEEAERLPGVSRALAGQFHPYVGYVEAPPTGGAPDTVGLIRPFDVSPLGFATDDATFLDPEPHHVVVGILGGSVAMFLGQYGIAEIERRLAPSFPGKRLVFANLAHRGYKQPQQLLVAAYLLSLGAEFDVLLNIDGFNEVALHEATNARRGVFPAYPWGWNVRVGPFASRETMIAGGRVAWLRESRARLSRAASRLSWSPTANLIWKVADSVQERRIEATTAEYLSSDKDTSPYVSTGPRDVAFTGATGDLDLLVDVWETSSIQLMRLAEASGARYVHVLQPNQYGAPKPMSPAERALAYDDDHPYRPGAVRGYPPLRERGRALREAGVEFHDLSDLFSGEPRPTYVDACCHLNGLGTRMLASAIAERLVEP